MLIQVAQKLNSLKGLHEKLKMIKIYLDGVLEEKAPVSREIIYNLQVNFFEFSVLLR
jgi:hypothetical protein